jgi:hypothetical protein
VPPWFASGRQPCLSADVSLGQPEVTPAGYAIAVRPIPPCSSFLKCQDEQASSGIDKGRHCRYQCGQRSVLASTREKFRTFPHQCLSHLEEHSTVGKIISLGLDFEIKDECTFSLRYKPSKKKGFWFKIAAEEKF